MTTQVPDLSGEHLVRVNTDECWLWAKSISDGDYGIIYFGTRGRVYAHRAVYESEVGEIPEGLVLDHLCRVPRCVNPSHLEPVTQQTNILRGIGTPAINAMKTHCPRGHQYNESNTYILKKPNGRTERWCRECKNLNATNWRLKHHEPAQPQTA